MSDYYSIELEPIKINRFIHVEYGTDFVTLSMVEGPNRIEMALLPYEAETLAGQLQKAAREIKKQKRREN